MVFRVVEYGGFGSGRPFAAGIPGMFALQAQVVAPSATVSTLNLSSATRLIMVDSDTGCIIQIGSSLSTVNAATPSSGTVQTSTAGAGIHIFANLLPQPIYVNPSSRLTVVST